MNGLFGRLALLAAIAAAVLVGSAAPAYRYGGVELGQAFEFLKWGVYAAMGAGALAVLWLIFAAVGRSANGLVAVIAAVILAGGAAYFPLNWRATAGSLPVIHDITTDTANPPVYVALKDERAKAPNGGDYNVAENADAQHKAYADVQPLVTDTPPPAMFEKAKKVATDMGWEIIAAEPTEGRIEATDTTKWWGFKDDVVIRITAEGNGSRLDIRSMSRVGKSDMGKNAERIRAFLAAVKDAK